MKKTIWFLILYFVFCPFTRAQIDLQNSGTLFITSGTDTLFINGNLTNTSAAALINNGRLYIKKNLINNQSSMSAGTGTLYLNGTVAQSVSGGQLFKTYNLVSNNTAGITLNNNLSVSNVHTYTAGIITTSVTPNYLIYESGSSYAGNGDTRHVNGWVKKIGSTDFVFPVGNGTVERTVAINSLSASSEFNAKYLTTTPNPYQTLYPIIDVNKNEYWSIGKISGGSATVTINWDYSKVNFPNWVVADILTAGYNGTDWADNGGVASGDAATTGTITSNSISSFNLFTLGSKSYVLPLTLLNFTASRQGSFTQVSWTTEKEYNADRFIVERSDDGISFYAIAQIPARNSGIKEQYDTKDHAAIHGIAYYRLRLIDIDGKENRSRIVSVKVINTDNVLSILVNPVHNKIILAASNQLNGSFNYRINGSNGQLVQQGKLTVQNGGQYIIPLNGNPGSGLYILEVSIYQQRFFYKFIVQ